MFEADLGLYWKPRPRSGPVFIHSSLFPWLPGGQPVLHEAQSAHPSQPVTEGLPQRPEGHDPSHVLYPQMFARTKYTDHFSICLSSPLSFENNISYWEFNTITVPWVKQVDLLQTQTFFQLRFEPRVPSQYKISSYLYKDQHHKDTMVSWPSCLYNGKPCNWKTIFIRKQQTWGWFFLEVSDLEWYRMNCGMTPVNFQRFLILINIWKNQYHISNCIISILTRTVWICYILFHGKTSSYFLNWVVKGMIPKANCLPSKLLSHFRSRFND